jgi:hypothetical protein
MTSLEAGGPNRDRNLHPLDYFGADGRNGRLCSVGFDPVDTGFDPGRAQRVPDGRFAALVKANLRSITFFDPVAKGYVSQLFAPTPQGDSLPAWLTANARTPWGAPYRYCGYAPNPVGGAIAATASAEALPYGTVQVHDLTAPAAGPQSYIVSGARPGNPSDVGPVPQCCGLCHLPVTGSDVPPTCDDIACEWKRLPSRQRLGTGGHR